MASPQTERGHIRIANELFDAELKVRMSATEWQVYRAIQRETYGWSRKSAEVSLMQLAQMTGLHRRRIPEAINSLISRNMVVRKTAPSGVNVYEIQKDFSQWEVVRKTAVDEPEKNGIGSAENSSAEKRSGGVRKNAVGECGFPDKGSADFRTKVVRKTAPHIQPDTTTTPKQAQPVTTGSAGSAEKRTASQQTWAAYAAAYLDRYGTVPVRNAKTNAQIGQFVERVGQQEAPPVAAFYVRMNNRWYIQKLHPIGVMLTDAEAIRTQWATNNQVTETGAKQAERTSHNAGVVARVQQKLRSEA